MSQSIPEEPVFRALRLSRRGSTPTTVSRGTALWESLVGKPRGKATDPLIHATGSVTLLLQVGRKAHVHAQSRDEDSLPWGDSRSDPRSISTLERNPHVPGPTPHKVLGPGIKGRGTAASCHHSQSPPDISVHSRGTCFPCTASSFTPSIDSHHGGTWDRPVGKPRGKASWVSHRSHDRSAGRRDTVVTPRDESERACPL
jgi:hypothetical protein